MTDRLLLLGTANLHKVRELNELLDGIPWRIQSLRDVAPTPPPVEDGDTFVANAIKKARYYAEHLAVACVADDSGLVVDALDGAPGVYSARYAGEACSDEANNTKLLGALSDVPTHDRTARFVCCAAYADPSGQVHTELGTVQGHIARECHGANGFGYDPLFVPTGFDRTFGEFDLKDKQAISHRGQAFRKLRAFLETAP